MLTACPQRNFLSHSTDSFGSIRKSNEILNFGFFVIVGHEYAALLHRFEKFDRQLSTGLNWKVPFVDSIAFKHDLRE